MFLTNSLSSNYLIFSASLNSKELLLLDTFSNTSIDLSLDTSFDDMASAV